MRRWRGAERAGAIGRRVATQSSAVGAECQDDGMASSLLDRAIYSYADVDRLVGLHSGTARRQLEGYEQLGRFYDPVLHPEPSGPMP
jgi:hypothetical protein